MRQPPRPVAEADCATDEREQESGPAGPGTSSPG